ncbi:MULTISPECIES: HlyD family secretion protein [unclassified Pseudomonas]|jgi:membrane fusion protein|uniref:HlyD family secretion protein n=1 Tax=unclassified Pseudomonas TaxID=196821 RepID=UPI002113D995|nr:MULTISPECIES: HlyD family efflux transporter periplasmic adaptor subunit [unclassified Pseudomonas]MCU1741387.1 HlyD family efflux transporter periplasmic adaptor subunit [Pseudomonas sp. 20S_6.2_Bac1]
MLELGKVAPRAALAPVVFAWFVCLFFAGGLVLLFIGNYAKKEDVQGRILTRDVVRITSERPAHIREVLVEAGDSVSKDQPLVRIRALEPESFNEGSDKPLSAQSAERLGSLLDDATGDETQARSAHETQKKLLKLQIEQLHKDLQLTATIKRSIQRRAAIAQENRQRHERLAAEGAVSVAALNEAIVKHEAVLQDLANNDLAQASAQQRILELEQRASEADHTLTSRLSDLARQRHELRERLENLNKSQEYVLLSPVEGVVDAVSVFPGARAQGGQPMMLLRISRALHEAPVVVLDVSPAAIGFAGAGTEVIVRVDAFPYERYGVIKGQIVRSTASTYLEAPPGARTDGEEPGPTYRAEVKLDFSDPRTKIRQDWLKDGMTLSGSLRLERLNLMEWLFLPVLRGLAGNPDYLPALGTPARPVDKSA